MYSNQLIMSLTVSAHEMPYALCFCSTVGIAGDLRTHWPNIVTLTAPDNCSTSAGGKNWALLILVMLVTNLLFAEGVTYQSPLCLKCLNFMCRCNKVFIWGVNSSSLSLTQLPPSLSFSAFPLLLPSFFPSFFPLFDPHFMFILLYPSSALFPLLLKGKLPLYTAEEVSVMMGTLQRNFLPSVQGTEKFALISTFFLPAFSTSLLPSNLFAVFFLSDNCKKQC